MNELYHREKLYAKGSMAATFRAVLLILTVSRTYYSFKTMIAANPNCRSVWERGDGRWVGMAGLLSISSETCWPEEMGQWTAGLAADEARGRRGLRKVSTSPLLYSVLYLCNRQWLILRPCNV